jgi:pterin-4a-carbinolamine dehydratase
MTATSEVRFGADGAAKVQSYVRLTASTCIRCCTYEDHAPILTIQDGPAEITITNPGRGEVTEDDVRFGRLLAEAVTRYAAELERLADKDSAMAEGTDQAAGRVA